MSKSKHTRYYYLLRVLLIQNAVDKFIIHVINKKRNDKNGIRTHDPFGIVVTLSLWRGRAQVVP